MSETHHSKALEKIVKALGTKSAHLAYYGSALGAIILASGTQLPEPLNLVVAGIGLNLFSSLIEDIVKGKVASDDEICQRAEQAITQSDIANLLTKQDFIQGYGRIIQRLDAQKGASETILNELKNGFGLVATSKQVEDLKAMFNERIPPKSTLFNEQWFKNQVEGSVADAEASRRYIPELNVELPIGRLFAALGRTEEFFARIFALHKELRKRHNDVFRWPAVDVELETRLEPIRQHSERLLAVLGTIEVKPVGLLPFDIIETLCGELAESILKIGDFVDEIIEKLENEQPQPTEYEHSKPSERVKHLDYHLRQLSYAAYKLRDFAKSKEAILANQPVLLLTGEGGIGKTHLFCDIAINRVRQKLPTILLLGEKFSANEPWHQIIHQLRVSENHEISTHLQSLNDYAAGKNCRILVLIDALNEGSGIEVWPPYLGSFLHTVSQFPYIALAMSVRSEYETHIIPHGLIDSRKLIKEHHGGFTGLIDRAVRKYFSYYGIEYRVPPLEREFQNPLFLQTLCRGLQNRNLKFVPTGLQGFTKLMEFFLDSVNERLAKRLDYNPRKNPVKSAIMDLVQEMASTGSIYVQESLAEDIVNRNLSNPSGRYTASLYYHLLAEGILTTTIHDDKPCARFLYDRFTDHLIAQHLLEKHWNPHEPKKAFGRKQPLGKLLTHKGNFGFRYSLIYAFAIQIPEKTGFELFQVAPYMKNEYDFTGAMISSLIWRQWKSSKISKVLINFVNKQISTNKYRNDAFLEAILGVAANPDNPFNADFLHKNLIKQTMAQRDAWWSTFLYYHFSSSDEEQTSINRLVSWAWSDFDKSAIDQEALRLMGIALAWFLTTSNRYLRDHTTKALICLFENHINILIKILDQLITVDDPYILERLFAVAYGCAMRSDNLEQIKDLAHCVFSLIFSKGCPPPHILLRDYARGVIEVTLMKCGDIGVPTEKIRPPYCSEWIAEPASVDELKKQYGTFSDKITNSERSMHSIHFSIMNWDFGTYTIPRVQNWTSIRLGDNRTKSPREQYEEFFALLEPEKLEIWEQYQDAKDNFESEIAPIIKKVVDNWDKEIGFDNELFIQRVSEELTQHGYAVDKIDEEQNAALQNFLDTLTAVQRERYEADVVAYEQDPHKRDLAYRDESRFDVKLAKRWILQRVFDLGWTIERFGEFDHYADNRTYGREAKKNERIGKKYQWIAFHELLARVADNFYYRGDSWNENTEEYEGTWQIGLRDIDPSFLNVKTPSNSEMQCWWFTIDYNAWDGYETVESWVESTIDLPIVAPLIQVVNPKDGSRWLNLDTMFDWEEPIPPIEDRYERPRRRLWYILKSYVVKREDAEIFFNWAQKQDFMGRWMPESHEVNEVFLGEFFWSSAFQYHRSPATGYQDWEKGDWHEMPCSVSVTIDEYAQSDHYDCSLEEAVRLNTPSRWLVEKMGLSWRGQEGFYHDQQNNLICFDPTASSEGPSTLLINQDAFMQFLEANDFEIVWTLLGEKMQIGGDTANEWLKISGAYRLVNNQVIGSQNTKFETRHSE